MKQTAVEWLFEQLDISQGYESAIEGLEQAKAMEKEQIISSYPDAYNEGKYSTDKTAEEYYNGTYKEDRYGRKTA